MEVKMEVSIPLFMIGFKSNPPSSDKEVLKAELLGDLTSEALMGSSSALYARLYSQGLINSNFSTGYESFAGVSLVLSGGESRDPDAVLEAILAEAEKASKEGLDRDLFDRLKKSLFGKRLRELNSFDSICYRQAIGFFEHADYLTFAEVFDALTVEDATAYLSENFTREKSALSIVSPTTR